MAQHMLHIDRTAKDNRATTVVGAICAALLFCGVAGAVLASLSAHLSSEAYAAGLISAAVVVIAAAGVTLRSQRGIAGKFGRISADVEGKSRRISVEGLFYLGVAGVLVVVALLLHRSVLGGGAFLANDFLIKVGQHTQRYALAYEEGSPFDLVLFAVLVSALVALLCSVCAHKGLYGLPLLLALGTCVGLSAGWVDAGWWILPFALGTAGCVLVCTLTKSHGGLSRAGGVYALCLAAVFALALGVCWGVAGGATAAWPEAKQAMDNLAWRIRYGDASFAMPEGRLDALPALNATDQEALTVSVEGSVHEYLRGFVGEQYADSTWNALDAAEVMQNRALFYWLGQGGFSGENQIQQALRASGFEDADTSNYAVSYAALRKPYAYLPYAYEQGQDVASTTDLAQVRGGAQGEVSYDAGTTVTRKAYLIQQALDQAQASAARNDADSRDAGSGNGSESSSDARSAQEGSSGDEATAATDDQLDRLSYLENEAAYRAFAYDAYTKLPESTQTLFQRLYGDPQQLSAEQAKFVVSAALTDTVAYNEDEPTENGTKDFLEYFLIDAKSGYSVHYATAATLLLRYYGIPARYVEGYVLDTEKLKNQTDDDADMADDTDADAQGEDALDASRTNTAGDVLSEEVSSVEDDQMSSENDTTYVLTEKQAHAWAEYYLDGVGWVPFDVTPGWGDVGYYETTDDAQLVDESQNWSVGEAEDDSPWTPPEAEEEELQEEDTTAPNPIFQELANLDLDWLWIAIGFLAALIVAAIVRDRLLQARLQRFLRQAEDETVERNQATMNLFAYLVYVLHSCGKVTFDNVPYAQQAYAVEQTGLCRAVSFYCAAQENNHALFAHTEFSADPVVVRSCIEEIHSGLQRTVPVLRRFWQRHIRCLW